jgi:hypothetical protein
MANNTIGERKTKNGLTAEFNGKDWIVVETLPTDVETNQQPESPAPFQPWSARARLSGLPAQVSDFAEGVVSSIASPIFKGGDVLRRAAPEFMGYGSNRPMEDPAVQRLVQAPQSTAGKVGEYAIPVAGLAYGGFMAPARTALGLLGGTTAAAVGKPIASVIAGTLGATEDQQDAYGDIGGTLAGLAGGTKAYKWKLGPAITSSVTGVADRMREAAASASQDGVGGAIAAAARVGLSTDPVKLLVQAGKPNTRLTYFERNLGDVLGHVYKWAKDNNIKIDNNRDWVKGLEEAQKDLLAQRRAMLPEGDTVTSGHAIADAMEASIKTYDLVEDPGIIETTKKMADRFRRSFTLTEAESMLQSVTARMQSYFGEFPATRRTDLLANPKTRMLEVQRVGLQEMVYGILEDPAQSAGVRELSRRVGAAMEAKQVFIARQNVWARQQPFSLNEQIAQTNAAGELAGAAKKAVMGKPLEAISDMAAAYAKRDTSRYLKEMQGLDKLIERAMSSYAKTPGAGPKPLPTGPATPTAAPTPAPSAPAAPPSNWTQRSGTAAPPSNWTQPSGMATWSRPTPDMSAPPAPPSNWTQRSGTATLSRPTPDMSGTPVGVGKRFTAGIFKGQTWAVIDGVVTRVK